MDPTTSKKSGPAG
jgi:hypothetical protein